jgi:hypothetical protein
LAVVYAYFLKSAAQRLGPTLALSGRQETWGGEAESRWRPVHSKDLFEVSLPQKKFPLIPQSKATLMQTW